MEAKTVTVSEWKAQLRAELDALFPDPEVEIVDAKVEGGRFTGTAVVTYRWPELTMRVSEAADETPRSDA